MQEGMVLIMNILVICVICQKQKYHRAKLMTGIGEAKMDDIIEDAPYGYCPICGAAGYSRERRPNGNDRCVNGCVYLSASAKSTPPDTIKGEAIAVAECYDNGTKESGLRWIPYTGLSHKIEFGDKLYTSPPDTQAKLDELQAKFNRLSGLAKEYDEAKDDADWESPHPIFCMAQDVDNLNAKLEKAIEALKYLDERFDNESWNCIICGHAESTSESDSAIYLKEVLKELTQRMML